LISIHLLDKHSEQEVLLTVLPASWHLICRLEASLSHSLNVAIADFGEQVAAGYFLAWMVGYVGQIQQSTQYIENQTHV
jgi:hypothetical protein